MAANEEIAQKDSPERVIEAIFGLYTAFGDADYFGEPVSQLAHALQAAHLAAEAGAHENLVIAALFHDLGHLAAPKDAPRMGAVGVDQHERIGAEFLASRGFSPEVQALVRGHVDAKRYLARKNARYLRRLSAASLETLRYQGGPMSAEEAAAFEARPQAESLLRLRSFDEQAKRVDAVVPPLHHWIGIVKGHLAR